MTLQSLPALLAISSLVPRFLPDYTLNVPSQKEETSYSPDILIYTGAHEHH